MSILIDFNNIRERLSQFDDPIFSERYNNAPIIKALAYTLINLEWEGTPEILSDAFVSDEQEIVSYQKTLERLDYQCITKNISLDDLSNICAPAFIQLEKINVVFLDIEDGEAKLLDYKNNVLISYKLDSTECIICYTTEYSKLFREPPPESQDKSNWIKYVFYQYNNEIKSLIWLSLAINILGAMQPFFIMGVYNFVLSSSSKHTLYGLTFLAILIAFSEYGFKRLRMNILATSGKNLSIIISKNVISKLLWLPYSMTSSAGISSQLARLKDIDQFRRLVTSESTLSYFDMPFVVVFIIAITIMSGQAAITVLAGILFMLVFCIYARYIYTQATSQSSRANAMVSYQWNELLRNISSIQGLPLMNVLTARFEAAHNQSLHDGQLVAVTNNRIQSLGQSFIQVIGTTSIVTAVFGVMEGTTDAGAMLAIIILVWKALGPIMGIYNSISKFKTLQASANQINALMSLIDDKMMIEKTPPINTFQGSYKIDGLTHRYQFMPTGLTNLSFKIPSGKKVSISGYSGSGKTTLLNLLAGLDERYQGTILLDGYNIKQFNRFKYRKSINYIPFELHLFEGTIKSNFIIHNGVIPDERIEFLFDLFELNKWFGSGVDTVLSTDLITALPNGIKQLLRIAIGLGNMKNEVVIIDEPFAGCEYEYSKFINRVFTDFLANSTVVFTTNENTLIAASDLCLLLDKDGNQKFFGLPDKVIQVNN